MGLGDNIKLKKEYDEIRDSGSIKLRGIIWQKSDGICWYCGVDLIPWKSFSVDHLIPISKGGGDEYANVVPCCRKCNIGKRDRNLEEFREKLAKRVEGGPSFTKEQMEWLARRGVRLEVERYVFWFEKMEEEKS